MSAPLDDETDPTDGLLERTRRNLCAGRIAHEVSLDADRWQLGHTDPSVTFQHYVAHRTIAPDVRHVLDQFFGALSIVEPC
ncbi:hypothetical protein JCM18899A_09610 [Nocardioides sp. AN3]